MISIDEAEIILNEIAEEVPKGCYKDLNGGILLLPNVKMHPQRKADDLYIMGEYHHSANLGKYIVIYYGSFERAYGCLSSDLLREKLRKTLFHEFIHHVEALAGEHGLEVEDVKNLERYLQKHNN